MAALLTLLALLHCWLALSHAAVVPTRHTTRSLKQAATGQPCHIGCFADAFPHDPATRAFPRRIYNDTRGNSPEECRAIAVQRGYNIYGLQWGRECWVSKALTTRKVTRYGSSSACNYTCPGSPGETCGGWFANDIYTVTPCPVTPSPTVQNGLCPANATFLPGMVVTTFKAINLPSSYCPLGGSLSGALGTDADWRPEDWELQSNYSLPHNTAIGNNTVNISGSSRPFCWVYHGYFMPTSNGIHEIGMTADDGAYLMMNLGGRQNILSGLGAATFYGNLTLNVPLTACKYYEFRITACNCQGPYHVIMHVRGPDDPANTADLTGRVFHTAAQEL